MSRMFSRWAHRTYHVEEFVGYDSPRTERPFVESNVVSSEIADGPNRGQHTLALDLDVPAVLVPSSTPGHSHLYIDVPMQWTQLEDVLTALAKAGVIEPGFAHFSIQRKFTCLRMPWVRKAAVPDGTEPF